VTINKGGEFSVKGEILTAFLQTFNNFLTTFLLLKLKLAKEARKVKNLTFVCLKLKFKEG